VRRLLPLVLATTATTACGAADERVNDLRPPTPVTMTAAIHADGIRVTPTRVGAGPVVLIVSNQSGAAQTVTFETDELAGGTGATTATSPRIAPRATGRLTLEARPGTYAVRTDDDAVAPTRIRIGPPRPSPQDRVLLP
jgi:hypothetical protein